MSTKNFRTSNLGLEEAEEPEIKLSAFAGIPENIYLSFIDYIKVFDCVDHNKLGNS